MTLLMLVAVAAMITYLSRALSLSLLPAPRGWLLGVIERLPAPLFAGLAVVSLVGEDLILPSPPVLLAAAAALAVTPRRSLATTLAAGLAAYALGLWLL